MYNPSGERPGSESIRRMEMADIRRVVEVHMKSFKGFFLTFLGRPFLRLYYEGILRSPDGISLVSSADREVVGFVVGFKNPRGVYRRLLRKDWFRFATASLWGILRRPRTILRLLRAFVKPFETPGREAVELSSVAVSPKYQGKGIAKALVETFIGEARKTESEYLYLTTDAMNNERARRFYERMGFQLTRTFVSSEGRTLAEYKYCLLQK